MKNIPKRFILATVAVIIALVAGGLFWYASVKEKQSQLEQKQNESMSDIDTSQWSTYKDDKMGFEVKYPVDIYRPDNSNITFLGIRFVAINDDNRDKYGDITILVNTLESAIFTGKSPEEVSLFKQGKNGDSLSWKDAYVYGGYFWPNIPENESDFGKRFFYSNPDNAEMTVECADMNVCNDVYGMQLFTADRMFSVNSTETTSKNPIYKQFLFEFKAL
jgi:hypothetical protein